MATLSCRPLELSTRLRTRTQGNLPPRVAITGLRGESLYPLVPLRDSTWPRFVHDWNFQHTYVRGPPTMSGGSPASEVESLYPLVPLRDSTWPRFRACHGSFQYAYVRGPPHHEWRITSLRGRKSISPRSPSGFHMATLTCMPPELSTHLRGISPTMRWGSPTSR